MSTNPRVKLHTNQGDIIITLNAEKAPKSVENFVAYTRTASMTARCSTASSTAS